MITDTGHSGARASIALDGTWQFAPDDDGAGLDERWHRPGHAFPQQIAVPGCWQAQGIYCQRAWYRRQVTVPADWRGRRIVLHFGGVSYLADVWVNGQHVGQHEGALVPFEIDVTAPMACGQPNEIVVRVQGYDYGGVYQSEQMSDKIVGLYGGWTTWAGIFQPVELAATPHTWIDDLFLIPDVTNGTVTAQVRIGHGGALPGDGTVEVRIAPWLGGAEVGASASIGTAAGDATLRIVVPMPGAELWEPDHPFLYAAHVTLRTGEGADAVQERFGMRQVEVRGRQILLNGRPIFLRGWLCDCIYPDTISPTLTAEDARRVLSLCKEHGFNFVRHHTHPEPPVYHDMADELGVLQLEEFASFGSIGGPRVDPTQRTRAQVFATWRGMIERDRNHPSIIAFGINNECWPRHEFTAWAPIYRDLYRAGKALDPTRLIVDNSGGEDRWSVASDLFDKHSYHFPTAQGMRRGQWGNRPILEGPNVFYDVDLDRVSKPCMVSEVGGWCTFPDFARIRAHTGGATPWWLSRDPRRNPGMGYERITRMEEAFAEAGLAGAYPAVVANSERFAAMGNKLQIEQMRAVPGIAAYSYCSFTDCYAWTCGIVDNNLGVKSHARAFAAVNQPSVLLWPQNRFCFRMGEDVEAAIALSHYGDRPFAPATLHWELAEGERVLLRGEHAGLQAACYQVQPLATLRFRVPTLPRAAGLTLRACLQGEGQEVHNEWHLWAFPALGLTAEGKGVALFDPAGRQPKLAALFPFMRPAGEAEALQAGLVVATRLSEALVRYLEGGGRVLWLESGDELNCRPYSNSPIVDYQATLIADHPLLAGFPHEGWCDMQFHNLLGNAVLDTGFFAPGKLTPIVEAFHVPYSTRTRTMPFRRKGFLAEAQVGRGRLVASSFAFAGLGAAPEVDAMAGALLGYLLAPLPPAAHALSGDDLREWAWLSAAGEQPVDYVPYG